MPLLLSIAEQFKADENRLFFGPSFDAAQRVYRPT